MIACGGEFDENQIGQFVRHVDRSTIGKADGPDSFADSAVAENQFGAG
jgi:hypothetical protein